MAYRAATAGAAGVIVLAADVPPDVQSLDAPVLIGRGNRDDWYTEEKLKKDLKVLPNAQVCIFNGAHEWTNDFRSAAADFLRRIVRF
jgi:pimeloyl-ACP methyl ester carboxylesterase